jgi:hypothetical protein
LHDVRIALVWLALAVPGCTINLVKKPATPEVVKEKIGYFKWLYDKGILQSDPELLKRAALKLLEVPTGDEPAPLANLEALLRRVEEELDRLSKEKR